MWLILLFTALISPYEVHEIHLSRSEVNYDTQSQSLQIGIKLFLDDFELALAKQSGSDLKLYTNRESQDADLYIESYLKEHIKLSMDDKALSTVYLGREESEDLSAVWCYIEVSDVPADTKITLTNDVFMEIYDDQRHIMVITKDLKRVDHWLIDDAPYMEEIRF